MAFSSIFYGLGTNDSAVPEITAHAASADLPAFESVRLGPVTLQMERYQLQELANRLCDYLALSQEEVACTGDAGRLAAA